MTWFEQMKKDVHSLAVKNGWWDSPRNDGEIIALIHSELSEALEALRHEERYAEHIPLFTEVEEELADVIIRVMDFAAARGYRLKEAIEAKHQYNKTRAYRHGKKF